jgi:hypothetical protein
MMVRRITALMLAVATVAACGGNLSLSHTETACITPGQAVTIHIQTSPGTELSFQVQDDFGGDLTPRVPPVTTDSGGKATVSWRSPTKISTTTLHFIVTAKNGDQRSSRDIHVVVGGNGRSC